jgi:hypothetical protein
MTRSLSRFFATNPVIHDADSLREILIRSSLYLEMLTT